MSRPALAALGAVVAAAAAVGSLLPLPAAVPVGLVAGAVLAAAVGSVTGRRLRRLAREVNRWVGSGRHGPVRAAGGAAWAEVAVALNALGAAYDRRGEALASARRLPEDVVEALPVAALLFGPDGHLVRANPAARSWLGIGATRRLTAAQALSSADLAAAVDEARALRRPVEVEARVDGRDAAVLAVPVADAVLVVVTDRSERRRVEAVRRDFVANASHELKTPVAGLQALADALTVTVGRDDERARALASRVADESERLGKLVGDLLDLHRVAEAGPVAVAPVDLAALVRRELARTGEAARAHGVTIDAALPEHAVVAGVEEDLRAVVANLLDNAVGYNRPGGEVSVTLTPGGGGWELVVRDTGIGIARHDLDRVFERFYRVDVARSRRTGGTGLGLSIVRNAVDRHGGTVRVESILGEGSTFTVTLPVGGSPTGRR